MTVEEMLKKIVPILQKDEDFNFLAKLAGRTPSYQCHVEANEEVCYVDHYDITIIEYFINNLKIENEEKIIYAIKSNLFLDNCLKKLSAKYSSTPLSHYFGKLVPGGKMSVCSFDGKKAGITFRNSPDGAKFGVDAAATKVIIRIDTLLGLEQQLDYLRRQLPIEAELPDGTKYRSTCAVADLKKELIKIMQIVPNN